MFSLMLAIERDRVGETEGQREMKAITPSGMPAIYQAPGWFRYRGSHGPFGDSSAGTSSLMK